jgi:adenosylcobinamide amidohydrolase
VYAELTRRRENGVDLPVLVWRPAEPVLAISSGALGGGIGPRHWVVNATVPMSYARPDPHAHLADLAAGLELAGAGTGLLTGVDVAAACTEADEGVVVCTTVGIGDPLWAAAPPTGPGEPVGTINVVAWVPARLGEAALVNAITTVAESKAQALADLGIAGTGTCTDAVVVACPLDGPVHWYGGPRSTWGARLARAVHAGVVQGGRSWLADPRSWSARRRPALSVTGTGADPITMPGALPGSDRVRLDPFLGTGTSQS